MTVRRLPLVLLGILPLAGCTPPALTVAISPDIPPYVTDGGTGGLEPDLLRSALPDHDLRFVSMPYAELQEAIPQRRADISVGVQRFVDDGVHYSEEAIAFENAAIARPGVAARIQRIEDLAGLRILAWQDASLELGPEFRALFGPGGPHRGDYVEFASQREQVRVFWASPGSVIVIDRAIFESFSVEMGRDLGEVVFRDIFPPATEFRVGFRDRRLRDEFDRSLAELCASGEYRRMLERHGVRTTRTICDG